MVFRVSVSLSFLVFFLFAGIAPAAPLMHVVVKGDTLSEIAQQYGVTVNALRKANAKTIRRTDLLRIGDKLIIPGKKKPEPEESAKNEEAAKKDEEEEKAEHKHVDSKKLTYIVQKGDTLSEISNKFGVSVPRLRRLNKIRGDRIFVGQELLLGEDEAGALTSRLLFVNPVKAMIDKPEIKPGRWKYVVVHHSATPIGNARSFGAAHERRGMENGLAYHFVIGNGKGAGDGEIEVGKRWKEQLLGGHLADDTLNDQAIGICFVGDFNRTRPTRKQIAAGIELIAYLRKICGSKPAFRSHKEINTKPTLCPGKNFPTKSFRRLFQ